MTEIGYKGIPREADERTTLTAFLAWQRATLAGKCEGLSAEQLRQCAVPPSTLSLLGLVRHLADVELAWFRERMNGEAVQPLYSTDAEPDGDFDNLDSADVDTVFASWREQCARADEIIAKLDLSATGRVAQTGRIVSLRWVLVHMIDEYSRHNGHADLLRQTIDGAVGYD